MVATNLKAEAMKLMDTRSALESEMNSIIDRLTQPGAPGLSGNLVDSEGFPRSDIDIPVVRADRLKLAQLRNHYKEVTEKIEQTIQVLHSAKLSPASTHRDTGIVGSSQGISASSVAEVANSGRSINAMDVDVIGGRPFAMVDEISEASPAAEDGLQLGDQIIKFGTVEFGDALLPKLAAEAQTNRGHAIPVVVKRQGDLINLSVTPREWQGRGLLGYVLLSLSAGMSLQHLVKCLYHQINLVQAEMLQTLKWIRE
ncbi:uncharacterized protein LOC108220448 isoform X1 [Daucus carota subsp. sativus]|uniref:uncharacterized protein LOC108220448 isoform X1 n=1 Tax=Daucus carota subsp. sativus TaxID=79200 RepID=UPI0007EF21D8|nr:PREDICTED: 26S proteasome non-ATPase regulatory subunit 9 isoform X1 [Daucus carota subsp. sativus]